MSNQFKTKQFKDLQGKWYNKLKDSGFEDIEHTDSPREFLKTFSVSKFNHNRKRVQSYSLTAEYYRLARHFSQSFNFTSDKDRRIWELHAEGQSVRTIAKQFSADKNKSKSTIHNIIKRLEKIMMNQEEPVSKKELLGKRPAALTDKNFILATWLNGLYFGNDWFREIEKQTFMKTYGIVIQNILTRPQTIITICCLLDTPDVILGYSIAEVKKNKSILHWIYVKEEWRKIGIAKDLMPPELYAVTHLTDIARKLKPKNIIFNPFLI